MANVQERDRCVGRLFEKKKIKHTDTTKLPLTFQKISFN